MNPYTETEKFEKARLSEIDSSMRWPTLLFLTSAVLWLFFGSALGLINMVKLIHPQFLANCEWFTFGRVQAAFINSMIYGWGFNVAFAVGLWIMARLCQTKIRHVGILLIAGIFWNASLDSGIASILLGNFNSAKWLELPKLVTPILIFSYALIGVWGIIAFRYRQSKHIYISQLYILAALFWFPWLYTIAQFTNVFEPIRGTIQAISNAWYIFNLFGLWITPIALAAAYYLIPKVIGKPIYAYNSAFLGFWSLALVSTWIGGNYLIGGPVPSWVITIGIVANILMLIPVLIIGINHQFTLFSNFKKILTSPTLLFIAFGSINFVLLKFIEVAISMRGISEVVQFTYFYEAHAYHGIYAFFSMIMFGSIYFLVPRILQIEWPSAKLIKLHFLCCAIGVTGIIIALSIGGWIQGTQLNNAEISFMEIVNSSKLSLKFQIIFGIIIAIGQLAFTINFFCLLLAFIRGQCKYLCSTYCNCAKEAPTHA